MSSEESSKGDSKGKWQLVTGRRRSSNNDGSFQLGSTIRVNPYTPFKPLFSQIAASPIPSHKTIPLPPNNTQFKTHREQNREAMTNTSPPASPLTSPPPANPIYYFSPHSPTQLRFPPSSHFTEWRGRCFRCCRTGHNSAACRNPMRCGKCWGEGHLGTRCKSKALNPAAMPYWSKHPKPTAPKNPPPALFDDLLLQPCPMAAKSLPSNRPKRLFAFVDRDAEIASEIAKLENGVVFDTHGHEMGFKLDDIVGFATRTKLVSPQEIAIGMLAPGRFIITLPLGMAPETFINATGPELWYARFTFQPWSPLDGAKLAIPEYKALITLEGLPPFLRKEPVVRRAVASFGTFLATVPHQGTPDLSLWTVVVAIDRLEHIPDEVAVNEHGLEFILKTHTKN